MSNKNISAGEQIDEAVLAMVPLYGRLQRLAIIAKNGPRRQLSRKLGGKAYHVRRVDKDLAQHAKRCYRQLVRLASTVNGHELNREHFVRPSPAITKTIGELENQIKRAMDPTGEAYK